MDANQQSPLNPFGMDENCQHCDELCTTRSHIVHGYGDVGADFCFVGHYPDAKADTSGRPFEADEAFFEMLTGFDFYHEDAEGNPLRNVFLTHLTRCRHGDRPPTATERQNCEPFLNAEIRMINPEILIPVGQQPLEDLAIEYTTKPPDTFDIERDNGEEIRGRGFELIPMVPPAKATPAQFDAFIEGFGARLQQDYRQTKGRRSR